MKPDTKAILFYLAAIIVFFLLCFYKVSHPALGAKELFGDTWWAISLLALFVFAGLENMSQSDKNTKP